MQTHIKDQPDPTSRPINKEARVTRLYSLLPRVGFVLLACCITMMTAVQSTYGRVDKASQKNGGIVKFAKNGLSMTAVLQKLSLSGLPTNAALIIHVHAKNTTSDKPEDACKGPVLFQILKDKGLKTTGKGTLNLTNIPFARNPTASQDLFQRNQISTWRLNVHDADQILADGKPKSVACGSLDKNGIATLTVK